MKETYTAPEAKYFCCIQHEAIAAIDFIDIFNGTTGPDTAAKASGTDIHITIK